jgi:hypothetical protein
MPAARPDHRLLRAAALLLGLALTPLAPADALADKYDIALNRLGTVQRIGTAADALAVDLNEVAFENLVRDLGLAMAPKMVGPANTLGALGFLVGLEVSWTDINQSDEHWRLAVDDPDSTLQTLQIHMRKGLPFSLEVGATVTHLFQSEMWGVGMDLKFAVLEGFRSLPDLSFGANIHTVLGARDLAMLLSGGNVMVSKEFGIGGAVRIAPYAGYNLVYVHGSSHPVTFFVDEPGGCQPSGTKLCSRLALFGDADVIVHRGILGFQLVMTYFSIGAELAYAGEAQTYTVQLGADF